MSAKIDPIAKKPSWSFISPLRTSPATAPAIPK